MKTKLLLSYDEVISSENLLRAWEEFLRGKRGKEDVQAFSLHLMENILTLHRELAYGSYKQEPYQAFTISDPKPRNIHKPSVRDRLLHHAIYHKLYPFFNETFIFDSYSCREGKGTHRGFEQVVRMARKVSKNYAQPCWALKCDIRKFFDSIDHQTLFSLLKERIEDRKLLWLLAQIIKGFEKSPGKGMPLGNLTSQLFANVYMNPLDQFVKHKLKARHYVRYADDFMILATNPDVLMGYFVEMNLFLKNNLKLTLHPNKISLRKLSWGIDFVGYVTKPHHAIPRRKTVERMRRAIANPKKPDKLPATINSYLGYLSHVSGWQIEQEMRAQVVSS
jgi:retron-type reverse transcriptase